MRKTPLAIFGALLLAVGVNTASCSGSINDPLSQACTVVVRQCHAMKDVGDCIDALGDYDPDCIACVGQGGCGYFSECQRAIPTCNLPSELEPPKSSLPADAGGATLPDSSPATSDGG